MNDFQIFLQLENPKNPTSSLCHSCNFSKKKTSDPIPRLIQNKLVERPNTSYMMKSLDPLEFGRQRHKSSLLPGPELLLALFIIMIFQRIFWMRIFVWFWFFCKFSFSDFIKIDWKCMGLDFRSRYLISWSFFDQIQKRIRKFVLVLQIYRPKFNFFIIEFIRWIFYSILH